MATITLPFTDSSRVSPSQPGLPPVMRAYTPTNDADNFNVPVHVFVTVSGDITVRCAADPLANPVTFSSYPANTYLPGLVGGINLTGLTAGFLLVY